MPRIKTRVVTGFIPIHGHTTPIDSYGKWGYELSDALGDHPLACYYGKSVRETWLAQVIERMPPREPPLTWSKGFDPKHYSLEFHCVQHQKFLWLAETARSDTETDTFVWMDYSICRLPGMDGENIRAFLRRIRKEDFAIPGVAGPNVDPDPQYPYRRFLGPLLVVPRAQIPRLFESFKAMAQLHTKVMGSVEYEVNTLARCEDILKKGGLRWYEAEANATMLTRY